MTESVHEFCRPGVGLARSVGEPVPMVGRLCRVRSYGPRRL